MKATYISKALLLGAFALSLASCKDDFLDRKPLSAVSPESYYLTAEQLGAFTLNYYSLFPQGAAYGAGVASWDNGTDNQASTSPNERLFSDRRYRVASTGAVGFSTIRNVNWFIDDVETKEAAGKLTGAPELIKAYKGEAYFFRALAYFDKLSAYGDYPIITKPLPDDNEVLLPHTKRQPRNEVARFILSDLDKAIELLPESFPRKQRLTKAAARLLKSRIALYEGTFEKYHRGSGRVPGDATWLGKDKEWNKGKTFNIEAEIAFFLGEAKKEAKLVADAFPLVPNTHQVNPDQAQGWNSYYELFASIDPSEFSEVILWRQYNVERGIAHSTTNRLRGGGNTGWTRALVESFLMKNGLPIYAPSSGYTGDATIKQAKANRDERLQLFLFDEETPLDAPTDPSISVPLWSSPNLIGKTEESDPTGYRQRKFYSYIPGNDTQQGDKTATLVYRASEAYLNYIEASYELSGSLDADARNYWTQLRERAGITGTIEQTINATDMSIEANVNRDSYDWGAFSAGQPIDATLYSIRRERRCEFAGEGERWDHLVRWRALDQVRNYQIEGVNFWTTLHTYAYQSGGNRGVVDFSQRADGSAQAWVSNARLSKYLRPYQRVSKENNNEMFDGYTFYQAFYLAPFSVLEMQLASETGDANNSNLYQNPGWKTEANTGPQF